MPLNTLYALPDALQRGYRTTQLDWWAHAELAVEGVGNARLTALPSQHFTARGVWDRNHALWASWSVEQLVVSNPEHEAGVGAKVWFGGDTGKSKATAAYKTANTISIPKHPFVPRSKRLGNRLAGVWRLTSEPIDEPPKRLAEARNALGIDQHEFGVMEIGETRGFVVFPATTTTAKEEEGGVLGLDPVGKGAV
ncbi:hypothetical protein QFC19_002850 [Naganishia cerealis]|uniref:Uncharacterized protein n=1 Tax=Naganishia cerealis TaxID=610337 RepID=A0ACC2W7W6_9TREE|nr:hypothetical protein QFC19_002850 [Naganishia cerealis]